jgi:hypothetical protein
MNIIGKLHTIQDHVELTKFQSHPQTNFGFLGFMDLFFNTIYWGPSYGDPASYPPYVQRWRPLHQFVFGVDPLANSEQVLEKEINEEQKHALAERRRRIMAEKKKA